MATCCCRLAHSLPPTVHPLCGPRLMRPTRCLAYSLRAAWTQLQRQKGLGGASFSPQIMGVQGKHFGLLLPALQDMPPALLPGAKQANIFSLRPPSVVRFAAAQAAEELVSQLGENEVFLHLRVQDLPAAGLYSKSGFEEVAADTFLVRFIGLDQRRLMRKRLPKAPPPQQPEAVQEQQVAAPPPPPKMQLNK